MLKLIKSRDGHRDAAWEAADESLGRYHLPLLALALALAGFVFALGGLATAGAEEEPRRSIPTTAAATPVTIAEARALPAGTRVIAQGQLVRRAKGPILLCWGTTRSLPPRCAGDFIRVRNIPAKYLDANYGATGWSSGSVQVQGVLKGKGTKRVLHAQSVQISAGE